MPYPRGMDFFDEDLVVPESEERPTQLSRFVVPDDDVPLVMEGPTRIVKRREK